MKKLALTAVLLGATTMMAPSAYATTSYFDWDDLFDLLNGCETLCSPDRVDIKQGLTGVQEAINQIVDVKDATDIIQKAVNAGNLVTVVTEYDDDAGANAGKDYWVLNKELGTVLQGANVYQKASNLIDGRNISTFEGLSQSATNVVNSITGKTAWNINQSVVNSQSATNTMWGGSGGYDATDINIEDPDLEYTQTAVNASNLIDISTLKNDIVQTSNATQDAVNVATFDSSPKYYEISHGYKKGWLVPTGHWEQPDVYDLGQSATNVTNSITLESVQLGGYFGGCACGFEIDQFADADQYASNLIKTMGNVTNSIQSATNVANSISVPSAP